jgi:mannose-6-phosphate isomerase
MVRAARRQADMLVKFRKGAGLYRRAINAAGEPTGCFSDEISRSYDQCFVILGLSTWNRIEPSAENLAEIEACWRALSTTLTDPETGLLLEDDSVTRPAANDAPPRSQNPHMHLYEACLQSYQMTGDATWLTRATMLRKTALRHFFDDDTDSLAEFVAPDLSPLAGDLGARREPGHQYEWAWLLAREAELGGDDSTRLVAQRLVQFAERFGLATSGVMEGAAVDAVFRDGRIMDGTFLLWPQTEAIKVYAIRHLAGDAGAGQQAQDLLCLMFQHWFCDHSVWVNRVSETGAVIWPEALTRLFYHIVLALTEGARAGLWPAVPSYAS